MTSGSRLPYELRIGVTGHLDARGPGLDEAVDRLLTRIEDMLADPAVPLSLVIVSPLANGADRVVARAGLAHGARLETILPLELNEYRKDFQDPDDLEDFDDLYKQSTDITPRRASESQHRPADYRRAGEDVVNACEILIAVWDDTREEREGGTADIVRYAVAVERMVLWIHAKVPQRSVVRYDGKPRDFPATAAELSPGYAQQVAYCRDDAVTGDAIDEKTRAWTAKLETQSAAAELSPNAWKAKLQPLLREHARADLLAMHYGGRHIRNVNSIVLLAAAGVIVGIIQVLLFEHHEWIIGLEVLSMIAVVVCWIYGRSNALHRNWLRSRFLAERLRAATFTTLTGGGNEPADQPLPFYGGPHHWMTRVVESMSQTAQVSGLPLDALKKFVASAWIEDQRSFQEKTHHEKERAAHLGEIAVPTLFGVTLIAAILHFLHIGGHVTAAVALIAPVYAGAIHALLTQLETERIAERSKRMATALAHLHARALRAQTEAELRDCATTAAALMHDETHEWWVLLSFQNVRLHV